MMFIEPHDIEFVPPFPRLSLLTYCSRGIRAQFEDSVKFYRERLNRG